LRYARKYEIATIFIDSPLNERLLLLNRLSVPARPSRDLVVLTRLQDSQVRKWILQRLYLLISKANSAALNSLRPTSWTHLPLVKIARGVMHSRASDSHRVLITHDTSMGASIRAERLHDLHVELSGDVEGGLSSVAVVD
jgi:hypothetical protein